MWAEPKAGRSREARGFVSTGTGGRLAQSASFPTLLALFTPPRN